ncbi:MAG: hypothetical protein HY667_02205 [Chloroflexi bacterium]|nr:hypothetical protein [Chloroflexota bacterium]
MPKRKKADIANILGVVTGPLKLFALIVLVIEVAFGVIAAMSEGPDRTYLINGMIGAMLLIILAVAGMAIWRPHSLYAPQEPALAKPTLPKALVKDCFTMFKQTLRMSTRRDLKLRLNFLRYDAKRNKVIMYVQDDEYQDKYFETEVESGSKQGMEEIWVLHKNDSPFGRKSLPLPIGSNVV